MADRGTLAVAILAFVLLADQRVACLPAATFCRSCDTHDPSFHDDCYQTLDSQHKICATNCITRFSMTSTGLRIQKGCADDSTCLADWWLSSSTRPDCHRDQLTRPGASLPGHVTCSVCCSAARDGDIHCSDDVFPPDSTLVQFPEVARPTFASLPASEQPAVDNIQDDTNLQPQQPDAEVDDYPEPMVCGNCPKIDQEISPSCGESTLCYGDKPLCMTSFFDDGHLHLIQVKRCAAVSECWDLWYNKTRLRADCMGDPEHDPYNWEGTKSGECHYCCHTAKGQRYSWCNQAMWPTKPRNLVDMEDYQRRVLDPRKTTTATTTTTTTTKLYTTDVLSTKQPTARQDTLAPTTELPPATQDTLTQTTELSQARQDTQAPTTELPQARQDTQAPTTEQPPAIQDTLAPTTEQPPAIQDTLAPTTELSSARQDTLAPTTELPPARQDTLAPTTEQPTVRQDTLAPTTELPPARQDTLAPTTEQPTVRQDTLAPTTEQPTVRQDTLAPTTEQPPARQDTLALTTEQPPARQVTDSPTTVVAEPQTTKQDKTVHESKRQTTRQDTDAPTTEQQPSVSKTTTKPAPAEQPRVSETTTATEAATTDNPATTLEASGTTTPAPPPPAPRVKCESCEAISGLGSSSCQTGRIETCPDGLDYCINTVTFEFSSDGNPAHSISKKCASYQTCHQSSSTNQAICAGDLTDPTAFTPGTRCSFCCNDTSGTGIPCNTKIRPDTAIDFLPKVTSAATTPTPAPAVSSRSCLQCGDPVSGKPCGPGDLLLGTSQPCPPGLDFCMNDIYEKAGDGKTIYKRCVAEEECKNKWFKESSDSPECTEYNPRGVVTSDLTCHFCCTSDGCNVATKPKESTLWTPFFNGR